MVAKPKINCSGGGEIKLRGGLHRRFWKHERCMMAEKKDVKEVADF